MAMTSPHGSITRLGLVPSSPKDAVLDVVVGVVAWEELLLRPVADVPGRDDDLQIVAGLPRLDVPVEEIGGGVALADVKLVVLPRQPPKQIRPVTEDLFLVSGRIWSGELDSVQIHRVIGRPPRYRKKPRDGGQCQDNVMMTHSSSGRDEIVA